jgi:hypothetical protein
MSNKTIELFLLFFILYFSCRLDPRNWMQYSFTLNCIPEHLNEGFPSNLIADEVSPEDAGMATGSDTPTSIIILSDFDSSLTASDSCVHSSETIGV